ncbi:MAG TPA: ATP-binding protein [bacterium]|nr:ATP-binding protein [bacterium]
MKELVVISGKGGTGKTSIVASFAALAGSSVLADCDVDAADLHLVLKPDIKQRENFSGGRVAYIDPDICMHCDRCRELCRFDAISEDHVVDTVSCEGCAVCAFACPVEAAVMKESINGEWFISETRHGTMVHARLGIAEENSGKLVTLVRNQAKRIAGEKNLDMIIVDGSPGIGCPVIASVTGADMVLIVTEPTLSGLHDLERVADLADHFGARIMVCINKADINPDMADRIEAMCVARKIPVPARIEYNTVVTAAQVEGLSVVEFGDSNVANQIRALWSDVKKQLG